VAAEKTGHNDQERPAKEKTMTPALDDNATAPECLVAFDLETTGLSAQNDRIVEVGAVRFSRAGDELGRFQSLVNPRRPIPQRVQWIHGISDADVADAPEIGPVLQAFLHWIGPPQGTALLAHNARFDAAFLGAELGRNGLAMPGHHVIDTLPLARKCWPEFRGHGLDALTERLGLDSAEKHRALADSLRVRSLWLAIEAAGRFEPRVRYAIGDPSRSELVPQGWEALTEAAKTGRLVLLEYSGGSRGPAPRTIAPLRIEHRGGLVYVVALCHVDRKEKAFRLDRIQRFEVLEVAAAPPA
jgi:DNA polymerase-3 subunit epsilon